jgi:hypothetical protein
MKSLIPALAVMLFGYSALAQNTNKILENYIALKNALVNSDSKTAAQAAGMLQQSIKDQGNFNGKDGLLKASEILAKATTIEKQRAALNDVSIAIWPIIKNAPEVAVPVYYQYCPMKKAYWLSLEKQIKNPYYGSAMLTCGNVAETKE